MSLRKLLLLIVASLVTFAINAQVTASGTVYDENNEEVIGATVIQKGKPANGTSTEPVPAPPEVPDVPVDEGDPDNLPF